MLKVAIVCPILRGRPLSLAMVDDPTVIQSAAHAAILEAFTKAEELAQFDPDLGRIQAAEAAKLQHILGFLL